MENGYTVMYNNDNNDKVKEMQNLYHEIEIYTLNKMHIIIVEIIHA